MHNPIFGGRGIVARFAQYAGFRPKAAKGKGKAEDDEKDDDKDAASDSPEHGDTGEDPSDDHMESDDDDEKMESDDDDEKMQDDDDDEDGDEKKKKAKKKARRAEADDDDDEKMEDEDDDKKEARRGSRNLNHAARHRIRVRAFKEGRRAERARWTKILSSAHAAANLDTALRLASSTSLPSIDVIAELRKVASASGSAFRRSGNPKITSTDGEGLAPDQRATVAIQSSWAKAFAPTIEAGQQARASRH